MAANSHVSMRCDNGSKSVFQSIYWGRAEIVNALEFLEPRSSVFLECLSEVLNEYHGWAKSPEYYDFICGDWLMHFKHVLYAAYQEVVRGSNLELGHMPLSVFAGCAGFVSASANSHSFNQQLRSLVAEVLAGKCGVLSFEQNSLECGDSMAGGLSSVKRMLANYSVRRIGSSKAQFIFCRPYVRSSSIEWLRTLWDWRQWARQDNYCYPLLVKVRLDSEWRNDKARIASVSTFLDIFRALLPIYLPAIYLEAFPHYRQKALALKLPRPKVIYTASSLHDHVLFKTLAADWREEGTKILSHQHGGGYGLGLIEPNENYEVGVSDLFYTAGWSKSGARVKPLVTPLADCSRELRVKNRVLLNLLAMPRYVFRIQFAGMPGTNEIMISKTVDFVRRMKGRSELVVRPYPQDFGWGMVKTLQQVDPDLALDDVRVTGIKSYSRSSVVVHNYLGTSWLETLALNIPTVCFYDVDVYAFRDAAQPYIDRLVAVGILHQSGDRAAQFVLDVMGDPQRWWQKPEVQEARQLFVRNYANFSSDWKSQWETEFQQWLA